jgi:putative ABC transport system substrate-binding protein
VPMPSSAERRVVSRFAVRSHVGAASKDSPGYVQRARLGALAVKYRMPFVISQPDYMEYGGLMSYGPRYGDTWGRAAYFIDRLFKGAKPSELPVEQSATFKLVVNLKTAKALGITIPESMLFRADEVIR